MIDRKHQRHGGQSQLDGPGLPPGQFAPKGLRNAGPGTSSAREGRHQLRNFAVAVEERIPQLLAQLKPGRELHTNLEFYAAIVMEICGLDRALFTPTFAVARVLGWCANIIEQCEDPKIIRPTARYVGPAAPQPLP